MDCIRALDRPRNLKQLRRFIGIISFYRKFILRFSELLHPLNELLSKNCKWKWDGRHDKAFQETKEAFAHCVVLEQPDENQPYLIRCDASGVAVAAILAQVDADGAERIIEITSRCLTSYEKKYSVTEMELLALMHAVKKKQIIKLWCFCIEA